MMRAFEQYWNNFLKCDKYDGIAFEDLIEELLTLMYGIKWKRTLPTHDGNRDFFLNLNNKTFWAECKNYREKISLKTLAPTLVMAQVCNANSILFFSRSEINPFAKEKITAYGCKTDKQIFFFDGELLERIILKYNSSLPSIYQIHVATIEDAENTNNIFKVSEFFFPSLLSKLVTSEDDYKCYRDATSIHYNEIFSLLLVIANNGIEKAEVAIFFAEDNRDRFYYEYLDKDISPESTPLKKFILDPGESTAVSFNLRVTKFKKIFAYQPFILNALTNRKKHMNGLQKKQKSHVNGLGKQNF